MSEVLRVTGAPLVYVTSAVLFFLGLKSLVKVRTAGRGRPFVLAALALAVLGALLERGGADGLFGTLPFVAACGIAGGALALRLPVAPAPVRVAWIPALAGLASALVAGATLMIPKGLPPLRAGAAGLAALLGVIAFVLGLALSTRRRETARGTASAALSVAFAGWGTALLGFAIGNMVLIIVAGVAGTAGLALGRLVAAAAGRPFLGLLSGAGAGASTTGYENVRSCGTEEAAMILETAGNLVVLPGFGMAAAQAQHAVKEVTELLEKKGTKVTWVVHPAAGCVPGHMNIVLDEADVPHGKVVELSAAAAVLRDADAALIVGANDVVNPAATADRASAVYGMDVPDLSKVRSVFVVKRSLRPGASGVKNGLFEQPNTTMVFGDAKKVAQAMVTELKGAAH